MPVAPDQITPQWQTYLSWDEDVKPYLQWSTLSTGQNASDDAKLEMLTDAACAQVQNYLGRPIAPTKFVRKFSGSSYASSAELSLPYYPIIEIESVIETWGLNGDHELVYQDADNQGGAGQQMYQVDWVHGTLIRTYQGLIRRPWFPGAQNIKVSWTAGYNPVPADLRMATLELIAYWWKNTQEAQRTFAKMGDYDAAPNNGLWPGVPNRVTLALQPYSQIGIG